MEQVRYEKEQIKVCGKGGDLPYMHSFLLVAPDEQISTAVLTARNDSSEVAGLMATALLDVVLEERGKPVEELTPSEPEIIDSVPADFQKYEGLYCVGGVYAAGICRITFEDGFMYRESVGTNNASIEQYRYTKGGGFVRVNQNGKMTADREIVYFEEKNGTVYLRTDMFTVYPGLGANPESLYSGEKMAVNPVSENVQKSWDALSQTVFAVCNEKWSSQTYENPFVPIRTDAKMPGYLLTVNDDTGLSQAYKIKDEHSARFFATIPSSANRDLYDMDTSERTFADGTTGVTLDLSDSTRLRSIDSMPVFDHAVSEIALHSDEAAWYRIGEDMGGKCITVERPEKSAVFVYNKFRELVYSTHVKDAANTIDLPPDGYIVLIGEPGDSVKVFIR